MLAEWHVTPDYILANWTGEMFELMVEKFAERKQREANAYKGTRGRSVSDDQLFNEMGIKVKHGD